MAIKNRTFDNQSIHIEPGTYELTRPIQIPRTSKRYDSANFSGRDWWPAGEQFSIKKRVDRIGAQTDFRYYTAQLVYSDHCQVKSYESERWNMLVAFLKLAND